jgi:hypothetical protein
VCHMSHPLHPPWFNHPNNIWWRMQVTKFIIMQFSVWSIFFPLGPNILNILFLTFTVLCSVRVEPIYLPSFLSVCLSHVSWNVFQLLSVLSLLFMVHVTVLLRCRQRMSLKLRLVTWLNKVNELSRRSCLCA